MKKRDDLFEQKQERFVRRQRINTFLGSLPMQPLLIASLEACKLIISLPGLAEAKSQKAVARTCKDITKQGLTAKGTGDNGEEVSITLPADIMKTILNFLSPLPEENIGVTLYDTMKLQTTIVTNEKGDKEEKFLDRGVNGSQIPVINMIIEKGFVKKLKKEAENNSLPEQGQCK